MNKTIYKQKDSRAIFSGALRKVGYKVRKVYLKTYVEKNILCFLAIKILQNHDVRKINSLYEWW